ncbi:Fc.00g037920.m01.CDS01 [Cosmosporella sp. VM-42]
MRLRQKPFHPLLGHVSPDSAPHHLRWKNVLKPTEIAWLDGHRVQNQIVFPASGYISTAIEAARHTAHSPDEGEGNIRLIEVSNFYIHHAITFEDEDTGVEVLIELSQISYSRPSEIVARFSYSAALGRQAADLTLAADGDLKIYLGDASLCLLPERSPTPPYLIPTEESRLYKFLKNMEYNFTGAFRSLHSLRRKLGRASCLAKRAITDDSGSILVHPIDLDAAFQSVMLAYSYPGDDQLRVLHLPSSISKVRVNPALFTFRLAKNENLAIDSTCIRADRVTPASGFSGSVNVYATSCPNSAIQVDQLRFKPLGTAATEDRKVFYKMNWIPSAPDGVMAADGIELTQNDTDLLRISSRIATYYLRKFDMDIPENSPARSEAPLCHYLRLARTMTGHLKAGTHKHVAKEWENDTLEDVMNEVKAKR